MKHACLTLTLFLFSLVGVAQHANAQANPSAATAPADLERGLAGYWVGALEYRDYQNNSLQRLPMQTRISVGPDGATLTRLSTFDDGPKLGQVFITTLSLFDKEGVRLTSATFRQGRSVETVTDEATVSQWQDPTHWTLVFKRRGTDGDQAAEIRVTQTRQGPLLKAVKEVKPVDSPDSAYVFRNQTVLTLQP